MDSKKTIVLGASTNPRRYSFSAVQDLKRNGHTVVPVGIKTGKVAGIEIQHGQPAVEGVDTVTLYLNPTRQEPYYDYILALQPKRIIFNPGTENAALARMAREKGIGVEIGCTLVMLAVGTY
jgi:predicted CoA-binding protein